MDKKIKKLIKQLIKKLKEKVECNDNEEMHIIYDRICSKVIEIYEPKLKKKIDKITKGKSFWYA